MYSLGIKLHDLNAKLPEDFSRNQLNQIIGAHPTCHTHKKKLILDQEIQNQIDHECLLLTRGVQHILQFKDIAAVTFNDVLGIAKKVVDTAKGTQWGFSCPTCVKATLKKRCCVIL